MLADLNRPETLVAAFAGAHGGFLVTNFWEPGTDEIGQGGRGRRGSRGGRGGALENADRVGDGAHLSSAAAAFSANLPVTT